MRTLNFPFRAPTWAPGRRGVTMVREESDRESVWNYGFDGALRRRVTRHWPDIGSHEWSPDGRTLVYQRLGVVHHAVDMRLVDAGRRRDRLLGSGGLPRWSPDGRWLVSGGTAPGGEPYDPRRQLVFGRIDGRRERRLTRSGGDRGGLPMSWQPSR